MPAFMALYQRKLNTMVNFRDILFSMNGNGISFPVDERGARKCIKRAKGIRGHVIANCSDE